MNALTPARRRVLVDLSDGEWRDDFAGRHAPQTLRALYSAGLIRCDFDIGWLAERSWTITPDGIAALDN